MSYDIFIGNAEFGSGPDLEWFVPHHTEPDAPVFPNDDMTGNGNSRHPGYSQWFDFCDQSGLRELFYGCSLKGGILSSHPGIVPLTRDMLVAVREALAQWIVQHPHAIPGWDPGGDGVLARLLWLEWWMDWALRHCERPAIWNM